MTSASRWFYSFENALQGPYSWRQLQELATSGVIERDDMLTQEGSGHWVRARALRGLFGNAHLPQTLETNESSEAGDRAPEIKLTPIITLEPPEKFASPAFGTTEPAPEAAPITRVDPETAEEEAPSVSACPEPVVEAASSTVGDGETAEAEASASAVSLEPANEPVPIPHAPLLMARLAPPLDEPELAVENRTEDARESAPVTSAKVELAQAAAMPRVLTHWLTPRIFRSAARYKWPAIGAGLLLVLGVIAFGFPEPKDARKKGDQGRTGVVAEEQEALRESPVKERAVADPDKASPTNADRISHVVEQINYHRKAARLAEVILDETLCKACAEHASYLAQNVPARDATPATVYTQDPRKPGHSPAGAKTAQTALIGYTEPLPALDRWMGRLFARAQILAPELDRIGIGIAQNASGEWISVLDPHGGRDERVRTFPVPSQLDSRDGVRAVVYPCANQVDVPCIGFDHLDEANGSNVGFPVSLTFPPSTVLQAVQATLIDEAGQSFPVRVSTPEQPLNAKLQRTSIGVHPLQPLESGRFYVVTVTCRANDAEWRQSWRFSTQR